MKRPRRPRVKRKTDSLYFPGATKDEQATHMALTPFNRAATESDYTWGIERLPGLVSPETASRYGYALADLNAAIDSNEPAKVIACANNAIKGLAVMDAEARAAGQQPATGDFWEYELEIDGDLSEPFRFAVMRDSHEWQNAADKRPDLRMFTMREVAMALKSYCDAFPIGEVKENFPGAEITSITAKPRPIPNGGDSFEF